MGYSKSKEGWEIWENKWDTWYYYPFHNPSALFIFFRKKELMTLHHYNTSSFQSFAFYLRLYSCFSFFHIIRLHSSPCPHLFIFLYRIVSIEVRMNEVENDRSERYVIIGFLQYENSIGLIIAKAKAPSFALWILL